MTWERVNKYAEALQTPRGGANAGGECVALIQVNYENLAHITPH